MVGVLHTSNDRRFAYGQTKHDQGRSPRWRSCRRWRGSRDRGCRRSTQRLDNEHSVHEQHTLDPNGNDAIHHDPEALDAAGFTPAERE